MTIQPVRRQPTEAPFVALVAGGRNYDDRDSVFRALDALHRKHPNITIVHGACCRRDDPTQLTGADRWAQEWAQVRQRPYIGMPAEWLKFDKAAGPLRNGLMLHYLPSGVVAFRGGDGTEDMCLQAASAGISVWRVWQ